LHLASHSPKPTILIASDSLSCLQALKNPRPTHPIILRVLLEVHFLQSFLSKRVVLAWCPGHSGIPGNERADAAAKSASRGPRSSQGYVAQDLNKAAQRAITHTFIEWWSHQDPATNKLRSIKAEPKVWTTATQLYRRDEVILARLRIGHTLLTHGHLMEGGPPPLCCGQPLSVAHLLSDCVARADLIRQYLPDSNIDQILADNSQAVRRILQYLAVTRLSKEI
jgi:RNase H